MKFTLTPYIPLHCLHSQSVESVWGYRYTRAHTRAREATA